MKVRGICLASTAAQQEADRFGVAIDTATLRIDKKPPTLLGDFDTKFPIGRLDMLARDEHGNIIFEGKITDPTVHAKIEEGVWQHSAVRVVGGRHDKARNLMVDCILTDVSLTERPYSDGMSTVEVIPEGQ